MQTNDSAASREIDSIYPIIQKLLEFVQCSIISTDNYIANDKKRDNNVYHFNGV